jgi:hypothetical protein
MAIPAFYLTIFSITLSRGVFGQHFQQSVVVFEKEIQSCEEFFKVNYILVVVDIRITSLKVDLSS